MSLTAEGRRELLYYMLLSRAIEDAAWALAGQGRLVGRLYTSHGQEAIPVDSAHALGPEDVVAPLYRDLGMHLVRGVRPVEVFSRCFSKRDSANGGRDSGLHIGDMSRGIVRPCGKPLEADPAVFLLGEDIGAYGGVYKVTDRFLDRFGPERVIDTPISENAIIGACTSAALAGMRPVAETEFTDFMVCVLEALVNMAATMFYRLGQPVPMVVPAPAGATWCLSTGQLAAPPDGRHQQPDFHTTGLHSL